MGSTDDDNKVSGGTAREFVGERRTRERMKERRRLERDRDRSRCVIVVIRNE